jgi:hypothetical protein
MADPRLILGRIKTVDGVSPGPSSGISYTISVHDPNNEGIYTLINQAPVQRWPAGLDINAMPVGSIVIGSVEANRVRWHFVEMPAFADCPSNNFASNAMQLLTSSAAGVLPPAGTQQGTIGSGSSESIPAPDAGAEQ